MKIGIDIGLGKDRFYKVYMRETTHHDSRKSGPVEEILNSVSARSAAQSAGRLAGRVALSPNMVFVLPREIIIHKRNGLTERAVVRWWRRRRRAAVYSRLVLFLLFLFPSRRACAVAATSSADLRAPAEVSLKEHSSSCVQSNTRPQSERKKYSRRSYSVSRFYSPLTVHL